MGIFDAGIGGLYKMGKSFLHPEKGFEKGQNQLDKYFSQSQGYLQPYQQQGQQAYGQLNGAMENLLNPSQLHDQWLNNYQTSDAAKFSQERAQNAGLDAASSMGLMGSTPALQSIQRGTAEIGAQDEQRYIERMIQQYLSGAGIAQNIYGTGAQAGNQLSNNALNMGQSSAELAFGKQNAPGQLFGNLLGAGANLYGTTQGTNAMNNMANSWKTGGR